MFGAGDMAGALLGANSPELIGMLDRLQYRNRVLSARAFVEELRQRGAVPAAISMGERFGVLNRALLGR